MRKSIFVIAFSVFLIGTGTAKAELDYLVLLAFETQILIDHGFLVYSF